MNFETELYIGGISVYWKSIAVTHFYVGEQNLLTRLDVCDEVVGASVATDVLYQDSTDDITEDVVEENSFVHADELGWDAEPIEDTLYAVDELDGTDKLDAH